MRVIVPWPPGGGADISARPLAARLSEQLGQQVVVDNRGGANGIIGSELIAKAPPDGYTIGFTSLSAHAINATLYAKLPFDTVRDFTMVSLVNTTPHVFVAHPSLPAKNVKDVIALAKARPGQITFASFGQGSTSHLAGELFRLMAGIQWIHVPYKGGGPAIVDVVGGQVALHFGGVPPTRPHVLGGRLRGLGVTALKRSVHLPDLPTVAEAGGLPEYELIVTFGVHGPAGLPREIVNRLNTEIQKALQDAEVKKRYAAAGFDDLDALRPEQVDAWLKSEVARYGKVIRAANVTPES